MRSIRRVGAARRGSGEDRATRWRLGHPALPTRPRLLLGHPPHEGEGEPYAPHSVVTDRTMTMAMRKGISLVIRQKRPVRTEVPAWMRRNSADR